MPAGISAWTPLANITVSGSSTYNITFNSIAGTYRDLVVVMHLKSGTGAEQFEMQFNSATSSYSSVYMRGLGSSALSGTVSGRPGIRFAVTGVLDGVSIAHVMDYSTTNKHKTVLFRTNDHNYATEAHLGRWASTAAITSIKISTVNWAMLAGATFALYGVSA